MDLWGFELKVAKGVYFPKEDTELVREAFQETKQLIGRLLPQKIAPLHILEMGCGSGILSLLMLYQMDQFAVPAHLVAVDKNPVAVECTRSNIKANYPNWSHEVILSDLFRELPRQKYKKYFDIVIFNPPYLARGDLETSEEDIDWCGGDQGYEVTGQFLKELKDYCRPPTVLYLTHSSLVDQRPIQQAWIKAGFQLAKKMEKKVAHETLIEYILIKSN